MTMQKISSHPECILQAFPRRARVTRTEKGRHGEEALGIGSTGGLADGASGFRRDERQIVGHACRSAARQIQAEAQILEHRNLEPDEEVPSILRLMEMIENDRQGLEEMGMRIALGQQTEQRSHGLNAVNSRRCLHQTSSPKLDWFDAKLAQMFVEPCTPGGLHLVAGLEDRLQSPRSSASDDPQMPTTAGGHHFGDGGRLAKSLDT